MALGTHAYQYEISFKSFVRPLPPHLQTEAIRDAQFHQFARLPPELQLYFLRNCDAPTLWQLMRTTQSLRKEASKQFWTHVDVWYQVDSGWFRSRQAGCHRITDYQKGFWDNVKQIVFPPERFEWAFEDGKALPNGMSKIEVKIAYFWEMVRDSFSSARRILLDNYSLHGAMPENDEDYSGNWGMLRRVVDGAPKALDVKLVIGGFHSIAPPTTLLVQKQKPVASNKWSGWKLLEERNWKPAVRIVQPGSWDLPDGPLRRFETMKHVAGSYSLECRAFRTMVLATHTRDLRSGNYCCPVEDCDFVADSKEDWHSHVSWRHNAGEISWASKTPQTMQALLEYKKARVDRLQERYEAIWLSIRKDMGAYNSSEWQDYMRAMEKEVQHYLFPEESPAHQHEMYQYMHNCGFTASFDPTHVYYVPAVRGYDEVPRNGNCNDDGTDIPLEVVADDEDSGGPQVDPEKLREMIERRDRFWRRAGFVPRDTRPLEQAS